MAGEGPARLRCADARIVVGAVALIALAALYLLTTQTIINGSDHEYAIDAGETQIVLNVWGTLHSTGYPLYCLAGALFTHVATRLGVAPATAPSLFSLVTSLLVMGALYAILVRLTGRPWLSAAGLAALGVVEVMWIHAVIAEIYAFSMLWWALALAMALLIQRWRVRDYVLLALILGIGGAHHRLMILLVPALAIHLLPNLRAAEGRRAFLRALPLGAVAVIAGFLQYLYLPLREAQSDLFIYGNTDTWEGFWWEFQGGEAFPLLRLPHGPDAYLANLSRALGEAAHQIGPVGLAAGFFALGALWLVPARRRLALTLTTAAATLLAFVTVLPHIVLLPVTLMPLYPLLLIAVAVTLTEWRAWAGGLLRGRVFSRMARALPTLRFRALSTESVGAAALLVFALGVGAGNVGFITAVVRDPSSLRLIDQFAQLEPTPPAARPVRLALPWGKAYFAASWGLYITGELGGFAPVDHRADYAALLDVGERVCTHGDMLLLFPPAWFEAQTRRRLYWRTCGPGLFEMTDAPARDDQAAPLQDLGNGVEVLDARAQQRGDVIDVWVTWRAAWAVEGDYSVYVHLGRTGPVSDPADMIAQGDRAHPVGGWYPTSRWSPGEVVPDRYQVRLPPDAGGELFITLGMYRALPGGGFENFGAVVLPVAVARPQ